jgi:TonB family protein
MRRAKNKGDREPVATVIVSSEPTSEPEAATDAAAPDDEGETKTSSSAGDGSVTTASSNADDGSVTIASSNASVERLGLAANPIAWVLALVVLVVGGWLLVVSVEGTPPWKAMRQQAPPPPTVQPVPSSKLGSEGAHTLAETPRPLDRQESAEAAMPRARQLEEERTALKTARKAVQRKAAENARTKLEAQPKAKGHVVGPAAVTGAQEDERRARADQERTEQEEMQRLQGRKMAEEAQRLAEERKRTQEARVAEEVARAAAVTPAATLPPRTAPPETTVELGQLVNVSDQGVIAPTVKRAVKQVYPPQALRQKVEGTVELNVLVDETGKVVDAQVVTAAGGNTGLNEAAVALVKKSMFHAPTKNGVPVKAWIPVKIDYRLPR